MSVEVDAAVVRLRRAGVLSAEEAALFSRVARRELVLVSPELRALLYRGILVMMAGVGRLVPQNFARIGPLAVTAALAMTAGGCLFWVQRHVSPFSWREVPSPHFAFGYLLLFGVLLIGGE